ncbi:hypothetical protein ACFQGW_08620 [Xanthomonas theicola]|nr:hypothetical protein [Xanthomonas theicola]
MQRRCGFSGRGREGPRRRGRGCALDAAASGRYKVASYALATDLYAWRGTWDAAAGPGTPALAGWMHRLLVESLLGLQREGDSLPLRPCRPAGRTAKCRTATAPARTPSELVQDAAEQADVQASGLCVDGLRRQDRRIALAEDGQVHRVQWRQPRAPA